MLIGNIGTVSSGEVAEKPFAGVIRLRDNHFQVFRNRRRDDRPYGGAACPAVPGVQKNEREIVRVDLQIPARAVDDLKAIAKALRDRYAGIDRAEREIEFVLGTINAPRPRHLDAKGLVHCLTTPIPDHDVVSSHGGAVR